MITMNPTITSITQKNPSTRLVFSFFQISSESPVSPIGLMTDLEAWRASPPYETVAAQAGIASSNASSPPLHSLRQGAQVQDKKTAASVAAPAVIMLRLMWSWCCFSVNVPPQSVQNRIATAMMASGATPAVTK